MNKLLVVGMSSAFLAGCGEATYYEPIEVTPRTIDLGESKFSLGGNIYEARSFKVLSKEVGMVTCGAVIHGNPESPDSSREEVDRRISPAGDEYSQVDCYYNDYKFSSNDIDELQELPVHFNRETQ